MTKKIIAMFLLFTSLITSGFGCKGQTEEVKEKIQPITLEYWRVWDDSDDFTELIAAYKAKHPFVTIKYKKWRYDEFEEALIDAFATDRGPDIFSIHNTWLRKYQSKGLIASMPAEIEMAYPITTGSLKKETTVVVEKTQSLNLNQIKKNFIDPVYNDCVIEITNPKTNKSEEKVFGLPLAIDTLALFFNRDLFNNAGITNPPAYWNREFQQDVKKLTKQNNKGQIIQSGVALGGSTNIDRSTDILSVLMMQNGTEMIKNGKTVSFNQTPEGIKDRSYNPGHDALRFYTDFANPAKEVYSWNNNLETAQDLFTQNKLAMMFGYSYLLPDIKAKAPKLNLSIAPLPQIEGNTVKVNFANYWAEVVSNKITTDATNLEKGAAYAKQKSDTAWDFIQFITAAENVKPFLAKTKKPTALRDLVNSQIDDLDVGVFAKQILTAKSWYRGNDANAAEKSMKEMIDQVNSGQSSIAEAIDTGASKVQQTINVK